MRLNDLPLLLDRDREVASLDAVLEGLDRGEAHTLLIEGRAGIGKSRLMAELRERAAGAGIRVLGARGSELEREFAFGVVRQLFEPAVADPATRPALLAGAAASAEQVLDPPTGEDGPPTDASFAALHGLYWLTANLAAEEPLVIAVDDLHWCDVPSLRFLAYTVKRLEGLPLLLTACLRPSEPGTDATLLGEIANDPATILLQPGPLGAEAIGEIVRDRLGTLPDGRFAQATHKATGGNPLLLHELVKTMAAEGVPPDADHAAVMRDIGPRAVTRTVLTRLARLGPDAAPVARAVAVLGEGADLRSVASLADLSEERAAEAMGALARSEILRPEQPLGFVHPLLREAIYRELPPGELELAHARAAELLREAGAPPEKVAAHLLVVPHRGDPEVVDLLVQAARKALRQGGAESAVAYLRRALEEPPGSELRPALLLELGACEIHVSVPDALDRLREAHATLEDPAMRAVAAEGLTRALVFAGDPDEVVEVADRTIAEVPEGMDDVRDTLEALALVARAFGADDTGMEERSERARAKGAGTSHGAHMRAAVAAWDWTCHGGTATECAELALAALADGSLVANDPGFFTPVAAATLINADHPELPALWERTQAEAHRRGSLFAMVGVNLWRGLTLLHRGELEEAEASLRSGFDRNDVFGTKSMSAGAYTVGFLARVYLEQGKLREARLMCDAAGPEGPGARAVPGSDGDLYRRRGIVELLLAEDRAEDALAEIEAMVAVLRRTTNPSVVPWRTMKALALDRLGRTDEAVAVAGEELEPARHWGAPSCLGRTLRVLGTLEREQGIAHLEEAVAVTEGTPARLEHAKALAALGSAVRRDRRPSEAREPLRRALELAESCGATPLMEFARSELLASGARPRTSALGGVESLTPSERRVADLALGGQTNRDIAQTLFVTPKTVEVHLSNTYRKLGISSRRELAGAMTPAEA